MSGKSQRKSRVEFITRFVPVRYLYARTCVLTDVTEVNIEKSTSIIQLSVNKTKQRLCLKGLLCSSIYFIPSIIA